MANYHKLITATNTTINLAIPGHKVSLPEFFKFSKHTEERMIKQTQMLEIDSWFDECLKGWENLESTFGRYIKDHHPKITEELKKQYQSKINNRNFSVSEINCFIKAAKFIVEYHNKQLKNINWNSCPHEKLSALLFSKRLIDAVLDDSQNKDIIEPTWLCSERTISIRLPKYLKKCGLLDGLKAPVKSLSKGKYQYDPGYTDGEIE